MTIRKRLSISYIVLVLLPFSLFISTSYVMTLDYVLKLDEQKNRVQTPDFLNTLYRTILEDATSLLEDETIDELIQLTTIPNQVSAYITLDGVFHKSFGDVSSLNMKDLHDHRYVNSWKFILNDSREGMIHFIHSKKEPKSYPFSFFFPILFYVIFITVLSYITSSTITRPLKRLKSAANSIKNEEFDIDLRYSGDDEIHSVFTAFDDMRIRLKDIVQKQLKYEKNRVELISNMSHDLKTPVTAIKGYIEGLRDGVANTPEKIKRYHNTIYKKVNLLDKLIEDLFLYSKLDLKTLNFNFQPIDSRAFLQDIVDELAFDSKNLKITLLGSNTPLIVHADPLQLQRVVHNIVGNSVKYCNKECCEITITLEKIEDQVQIEFQDNGVGIEAHEVSKIFKRFYRSDPARSSKKEGSGLGLAISKQIITEHNGIISAKSSSSDGLTITITLPLYNK